MSITDALKTLSDAHGSRALAAAFAAVQGQVRRARKAAAKELGALAKTYAVAMRIWDAQKADGVSKADRIAGLERTLRAAWPQMREWKYLCSSCHDYGLVIGDCPGTHNATCGRTKPHLPHDFGTPCWCQAGNTYRDKPKPSAEDFTQAGKSKQMTRLGR
jgi:hypothetical protein